MRPRLLAGVLACTLVLAGCMSDDPHGAAGVDVVGDRTPLSEVEPLADPASFEGQVTATLASRAIEPIVENPEQSLPTTVTSYDRTGEIPVEITDASRVVAVDIAGSIASTVWGLGLGDSLVARDVSTVFPGAEDLPVVTGDGHSVSAEAIMSHSPTLILTDGSVGPRDVIEQLRDTGVAVVFVDNDPSFAGASELARQVGAALGVEEAGAALADQIAAQIDEVAADIEPLVPDQEDERLSMVFLYIRGGSGVYYLFGEESGADELITALGGRDVAEEQGWGGMIPLTDEAVVAADPDVYIVMTGGIESAGGVEGLLADKPGIALTKGGQNRRFIDMADGDILSFGPRSAAVLDALARAVYAPDSL